MMDTEAAKEKAKKVIEELKVTPQGYSGRNERMRMRY